MSHLVQIRDLLDPHLCLDRPVDVAALCDGEEAGLHQRGAVHHLGHPVAMGGTRVIRAEAPRHQSHQS